MCRCRSHCLLTDCAKLPCLIGGCHQWYQVLPPGRVPGGVASARRAVFPCAPVVDRSCTHKVVVPCYRDMLPCRQQQDAVLSRHSLTERGQSTLLNSRVSLLSTTRGCNISLQSCTILLLMARGHVILSTSARGHSTSPPTEVLVPHRMADKPCRC